MPRDITVTFEDGTKHVYRQAPDDVTPAQVQARAAKEFGKGVAALDGGRAPKPEPTLGQQAAQTAGNIVAGAVRGAGSIGATLLYPIDKATDIIKGDRGPNVTGLVTGQQPISRNEQRRRDMDAALSDMGAETDSLAFKGGKLAGEIAGTAGAGGFIARGTAGALPTVAKVAPNVANALQRFQGLGGTALATKAPNVLNAIATSGMTGGKLLPRTVGGAVAGGASAGLVNPEDAGTGALVGGAVPGVAKAAGWAGNKIGGLVRGPTQPADLAAAVQSARGAGYVIPPTQANPTLTNRLLEGFSGKLTTAQNASAKNAGVTADLAATAIGLPSGTKITPDVLDSVRKVAGQAYADVAALPARPAQAASTLTNTPASPAIDPATMVFDLRKARNDATAWFRSYGRTADPDALVKAKAAAANAKALESGLEQYAQSVGRPDLVPAMREARTLIAKTHSVEAALNPATGAIDARKLAQQLAKGKPLSGELKDAAEFATRFPKAAQPVESMGSLPQMSPLDFSLAALLATGTANPLSLASVALRPAMRATALSPMVQNRLVQGQGQNAISALLANPGVRQLGYQTAPVLAANR